MSEFDLARIAVASLIGVLMIVVLVLDMRSGTNSAVHHGESGADAIVLSEYELLSRAERLEAPAYWVGRRPGVDHFEVEKEASGNLYIRYLTASSSIGGHRSDSLTVASYPVAEARERLKRAARSEGTTLFHRDGFVVFAEGPHDAYVVFDELPELQVEIYTPRRGEAVRLAVSGALTPLHWTPLD